MFEGLADQIMVMRLALAPVRLTKWQITKLIAKQIYRQVSFVQLFAYAWNFWSLFYTVYLVIYRLYYHPLAKYPGPKLAAVSEIWYIYHWLSGRYPWDVQELHKQYGPIVRVAPNELSFATAQSCLEIYGKTGKGGKSFARVNESATSRPDLRTAATRYFGSRSVKEAEAVVKNNADQFITRLSKAAAEGRAVDIKEWYSWLSFDIMGELVFGSSFDAVKQGMPHLWLSAMRDLSFRLALVRLIGQRIVTNRFFAWVLAPLGVVRSMRGFQADSLQKIRMRRAKAALQGPSMGAPPRFVDALAAMQSTADEPSAAAANALVQAGSEHTAVFLTSATYHLLHNPEKREKAAAEVRRACADWRAIDEAAVQNLLYLPAVIEEALRLFPPAPVGAACESPGAQIMGEFIPMGTNVSTCTWAVNRSSASFTSATAFVPERWLLANHPDHSARLAADGLAASKPFSVGPNTCPGLDVAYLEARLVVAKMLCAFDWKAVQAETLGRWEHGVRWRAGWVLPALPLVLVPTATAAAPSESDSVELLG